MRTKNETVKDDKHRMDGTRVVHKAVASRDDRWFDRINTAFLIGVVLVIGYPLWFVLIASISDPQAVESGKVWIWPVDFTIDGYLRVFAENSIWIGYRNTIVYTLVGVALHLCLVLPCAYALSRQYMAGRTAVTWYILFTMLFSGGIVPTYLVVKDLGMLDTMWAVVVPGAAGAWSILVGRAFFKQTVPNELAESAKVDGASDIQIFFRIAIPLSAPIIATLALFHGVGLWNEYFKALIYLSERDKFTLQLVLRELLVVSQEASQGEAGSADSLVEQQRLASLIKYAVMIVASLPLLIVYPFLQRFFTQGVLIGSVKE
ncbi:MAG TPA: carbohydrate ABC transporter permease [Candidatus Brachybacterium merdavium]|uniref:Carbohydrate ABC transporter permease n=1 Tax=Candidatus Brachybacterium merdavium TaxID=2838513 RepID=A0A9D2LBH3_9MICO|nr:carbohydrate ABC transporter permease [Candidatus Brevibacterium intestinavium]HJB09361.1 carbohydrate ABC transporter permease [Candidatus Brachybacterium merdavium]